MCIIWFPNIFFHFSVFVFFVLNYFHHSNKIHLFWVCHFVSPLGLLRCSNERSLFMILALIQRLMWWSVLPSTCSGWSVRLPVQETSCTTSWRSRAASGQDFLSWKLVEEFTGGEKCLLKRKTWLRILTAGIIAGKHERRRCTDFELVPRAWGHGSWRTLVEETPISVSVQTLVLTSRGHQRIWSVISSSVSGAHSIYGNVLVSGVSSLQPHLQVIQGTDGRNVWTKYNAMVKVGK